MIPSPERIPAHFEKGAAEAARALDKLDKILIATHINPDGDAIGAVAATCFILKALGREFALYLPSGVPPYLRFLDLPGPVYTNLHELPFKPESAVFVDCSEAGRLEPGLAPHVLKLPSINIDHHLCEHGLGSEANFIHTEAAAAAQLVAYLAMQLGIPLTDKLAQAIAAGLLTDTGQFAHANTNADVFALCTLLEANGCHFAEISENLQHAWTLRRLYIWGACCQKVHVACGGKIAWCLLTREDNRKLGIGKDDLEGFGDVLRRIVGVEIGIFAREQELGGTRFSMRSRGDVSVQEIAQALGGGGHRNAAGLTLPEAGDESMDKVLDACKAYLASTGLGAC